MGSSRLQPLPEVAEVAAAFALEVAKGISDISSYACRLNTGHKAPPAVIAVAGRTPDAAEPK